MINCRALIFLLVLSGLPSLFPQRTDREHDLRVRNGQIIKYAGDQIGDVSVIEDPASVEFTDHQIRSSEADKYMSAVLHHFDYFY